MCYCCHCYQVYCFSFRLNVHQLRFTISMLEHDCQLRDYLYKWLRDGNRIPKEREKWHKIFINKWIRIHLKWEMIDLSKSGEQSGFKASKHHHSFIQSIIVRFVNLSDYYLMWLTYVQCLARSSCNIRFIWDIRWFLLYIGAQAFIYLSE